MAFAVGNRLAARAAQCDHASLSTISHPGVTAVLVALAGATACKSTVDPAKIEKVVRDRAAELGFRVTRINCPDDVDAKPGASFPCKVELDGKQMYTIDAKIQSVDTVAGKGRVDLVWRDGVPVRVAALAAALRDGLAKDLTIPVTVACGDQPLRFLDAQRKLTCDVTAGDARSVITVQLDDKMVPTSWSLDPPLVVPAMIAKGMTPIVLAKLDRPVAIDCGPKLAYPRPADGVIRCGLTDGPKHATLEVVVDDKLDVQRWSIVPAR